MIKHMTLRDAATHSRLFDTMHEDRKRIFVDRLQWDIPHDGRFERDQYDTANAQYLILQDKGTGEHLGSVRLLPTVRPHMLKEVFPHLCERGVPTGRHIWEITRLVVSPRVDRRERLMVRNMLARAMIEFGLLTGIRKYTMVCELHFLSQLLASGWRCDPLGMPIPAGTTMIGALLIHNDPDSLARTKAAWRHESPVLLVEQVPALAA